MNYFPVTMGCLCSLEMSAGLLIVRTCCGLLLKLGKQRGNVDNWSEDGAERGPRIITNCILLSLG